MLELFPCKSCPYWLGMNPSCPECEEARIGGPVFQEKLRAMTNAKQVRIDRLRRLIGKPQVGLVGCGKSKQTGTHKASELYTGRLFRGAFEVASAHCEEVYILSAKHGLLAPGDLVESYDYSLYDVSLAERDQWGSGIVSHLKTLFPVDLGLRFVFYAGQGYVRPVLDQARVPQWEFFEAMRGLNLFQRMEWLRGSIDALGSCAC